MSPEGGSVTFSVDVVEFTAPTTATTTFDLTSSEISDWRAALIFMSGVTADATAATDAARFSLGVVEKGGAERCFGSRDGANSDLTRSTPRNDSCILIPNQTNQTIDFQASFSSDLGNGVRLVVDSNSDSAAYKGTAVLLGGTDLQAAVGSEVGITSSTAITGIGFEADAIICIAADGNENSFTTHYRGSLGFCLNDLTQHAIGLESDFVDANVDADVEAIVWNNRASGYVNAGTSAELGVEVTAVGADGFTVDSDSGSPNLIYLPLKRDDGGGFSLAIEDVAASTGTQSFTGLGTKPEVAILASSLVNTENTVDGTNRAGCQSVGAFKDGGDEFCEAASFEDAVNFDDHLVSSYRDAKALVVLDDDGTVFQAATLSSADSSGFTLNFTTASSTGKMVVFGVDSVAPGPIVRTETVEIGDSVALQKIIPISLAETVEISDAAVTSKTGVSLQSQDDMIAGTTLSAGVERGVTLNPGVDVATTL